MDSCSFFYELNNNYFIIGGEKGIKHFHIEYCENNQNRIDLINIIGGSYKCGIKINEEIFAFSSNSVLPNGKDQLIIYNIKNKQCIEINNYSFTVSTNALVLMSHIETGTNVLICGCKQYKNNQRNGICLVDLILYKEEFYDTNDFEVYCFCPISIIDNSIENNNQNKAEEKNIKLSPTNYFFAGGFEKDRAQGIIKLYKIKEKTERKENENNIEIEFMQDVIIEEKLIKKLYKRNIFKKGKWIEEEDRKFKFEYFQRNISCIIQTKLTGEILITSWDGNVYLFSPPNIDYYLESDLKEYKE